MSVINFFPTWTFDALTHLTSVEIAYNTVCLRWFKYVILEVLVTALEENTVVLPICG